MWIWPVVACVVLLTIGWWVRGAVEQALKDKMAGELQTILNADVAALKIWLATQQADAEAIGDDDEVQLATAQIDAMGDKGATAGDLLASEALVELRSVLEPWVEAHDLQGFAIINQERRILAADRDELVGNETLAKDVDFINAVFDDKTAVSHPFKSAIMLNDDDGVARAGVPTMFVGAPIYNEKDEVIAALCLRIPPEKDFTEILSIARAGESGETYAFDKNGLLLSQSRFDDTLKQIGLLTDDETTRSILNVQIRDPEVDMTTGKRPAKRLADRPLTRMAEAAAAGEDGVDVDGYRDYRGVPVVGAWTWLPEYEFGVATESDVAEAYRPLYILRTAFWGLFVLLVVAAGAIFVFSIVVARLDLEARRAALEAKQLGQYALDEKIGSGGMGIVYKAHHAMLQRPTAVKLLDVEKTNEDTIARFEREVRLTAQLNHPNTIAIYDYGRTPEGVFYYAMEYLDGIPLDELIENFQPQLEGRVINLLRQVCGSLTEAHEVGLIHRDVKPANIMLNRRGGMFDVVKVLDFGLVKAVDSKQLGSLTQSGALTGTPLYMSPEAINQPEDVGPRSDLYAVGAVGFYLLTGKPVFEGKSVMDICSKHVSQRPSRPSAILGRPIAQDLEDVILKCLEKKPNDRYYTARALDQALAQCLPACEWTRTDAEQWWRNHFPRQGEEGDTRGLNDNETMIYDGPLPGK